MTQDARVTTARPGRRYCPLANARLAGKATRRAPPYWLLADRALSLSVHSRKLGSGQSPTDARHEIKEHCDHLFVSLCRIVVINILPRTIRIILQRRTLYLFFGLPPQDSRAFWSPSVVKRSTRSITGQHFTSGGVVEGGDCPLNLSLTKNFCHRKIVFQKYEIWGQKIRHFRGAYSSNSNLYSPTKW